MDPLRDVPSTTDAQPDPPFIGSKIVVNERRLPNTARINISF